MLRYPIFAPAYQFINDGIVIITTLVFCNSLQFLQLMNKQSVIRIILTILVIAGIYLWGFSGVFTKEYDYYAYYENIQGLQTSSPVMLNGVRVGKIKDIDLNGGGRVKVTLTLSKDIKLPDSTTAYLAPGGITGDKMIRLEVGNNKNILPHESVLRALLDTSLMDVSVQITPMLETAKMLMKSSDSTLREFSTLMGSGNITTATYKLITVEEKSRGFARFSTGLNNQTDHLCRTVRELDQKVKNVEAGNGERSKSIADINNKTGKLASASVAEDMQSIRKSINTLSATFGKLKENKAIADKQAYQSTTQQLDTLNRSLQGLHDDPPGMSIFGGKKKK